MESIKLTGDVRTSTCIFIVTFIFFRTKRQKQKWQRYQQNINPTESASYYSKHKVLYFDCLLFSVFVSFIFLSLVQVSLCLFNYFMIFLIFNKKLFFRSYTLSYKRHYQKMEQVIIFQYFLTILYGKTKMVVYRRQIQEMKLLRC